jgi:hypothetical protein
MGHEILSYFSGASPTIFASLVGIGLAFAAWAVFFE